MTSRVVVVAIAALVVAAGVSAAPRVTPGRIVFSADAPLDYGEIYRIGLDGRRVDLSRSPAADVGPVLSPDGSLVAFASNRGGHVALYTVRIDGTGLRRVSPLFGTGDNAQGVGAQIAWTRGGTRLAADLTGYGSLSVLWIGDLEGRGRVVAHEPTGGLVWSPDATEVAVQPSGATGGSEIDVRSPSGKLLWSVRGDFGMPFGWSNGGRLAASYNGTVSVYDAQGHRLTGFRGAYPAWSPAGTMLATVDGRSVEVRRGGVGAATVDVRLPPAPYDGAYGAIGWLGDARLRVANGSGFAGVDVAHDGVLQLPPSYAAFSYPGAASVGRNEVAVTTPVPARESATLSVGTFAGARRPAGVSPDRQPRPPSARRRRRSRACTARRARVVVTRQRPRMVARRDPPRL